MSRRILCLLAAASALAGCDVVSFAPGSESAIGATDAEANAAGDAGEDRPHDSELSSVGPEGQTRIYYQFVDASGQVRFVERLEDVPPAWRERVGFVELPGPPPLTPAEARRASRADPGATLARGRSGPSSVVLYSADWCGYCRQAKRHLDDRGIAYELRDVDVPSAKAELAEKTGGKGIPVLDVDGRILRGYSSGSYDDFLSSVGL